MGGRMDRSGVALGIVGRSIFAAAAAYVLLSSGAALAQGATPTATPQVCRGSERVKLLWKASTRLAKVFVRFNKCDPPTGCDGGAAPLVTAPLTLRIEDAAGRHVIDSLPVVEFVKNDFCPGGHETFQLELGKLRYVFGSEGVTNMVLKTTVPISEAPVLAPPVRLSLVDANGYALETTFAECSVRTSDSLVQVRCDDTSRYIPAPSTPQPSPTSNAAPTRTPIPTRTAIPSRTSIP